MNKATHKFRALSHAAKIVASAPSVTAAAKQLGVDRATVHRWIAAGKVPGPTRGLHARRSSAPGSRTPRRPAAWARAYQPDVCVEDAPADGTFAAWARQTYSLTRAEDELIDLAQRALDLARDKDASPALRIQAMKEFRAALRDLALPKEEEQHGDVAPARAGYPRPA